MVIPHENVPPELIETNVAWGGVAWPDSSRPQQRVSPSVVIPQAWLSPTLIEVKAASGGVFSSSPQQITSPEAVVPHV